MVDLDRISIQNFKGHEDIAFRASDINIITGKNNVGKTSILESINLNFNPTNIRNYGGNADKLVNAHSDKAEIVCTYSGSGGQSALGEFTSEGASQELSIRIATQDEKYEYFSNLIERQLKREGNFLKSISEDASISGEVVSLLRDSVDKTLREYRADDEFELLLDSAVVLKRDDTEVPFVYISDSFDEFVADIADDIKSEFNFNSSNEDSPTEIQWIVERAFRGLVIGRHGRSNFLGSVDDLSEVRFVQSFDITEKDIQSEEEYSVILSRIEDDLRNYNMVENLQDFSLDNLVFEEDGDRYQLPYDFMGDGFKSIVGLLWELRVSERQNYALLLEEPENSMHPGYIRDLVSFLIEFTMYEDTQLFITTHNMDFIREFLDFPSSSMREYLTDNFQIIQVRKHASKVLGYQESKEQLDDLHLDLRGG